MSRNFETLHELLRAGDGRAPALSAPEGLPLSYDGLRSLASGTRDALARHGIGVGDRVAIVHENGPEMAALFLGVAAAAAAAPLNPAYRADEFEFYLTDLKARLLLVPKKSASPSLGVAEKLGIPVARVLARPDRGAGSFDLEFGAHRRSSSHTPRPVTADDTALVLHTSGTTSRPKVVPLAQRNLCASAAAVARTLGLASADRGMVIMPLFHIHGLVAGLLAPLSAGGEVCCTGGFNALKHFEWLGKTKPTWYTGVPTMHQAILARAGRNAEVIAGHRLRFIRSSSSALPPTVIGELEKLFGIPVIEAYGMTEAAHQMASNPLPPHARRPGTVGIAAGPEVRVVDEKGKTAAPGATGEIVIRGRNVMKAYEADAAINAAAFIDGWFRTGDQGTMDADGYLSITGRLKEIINRGGEKISPREVDEIIMLHPAVHQCVTFAMPHDMLGEDVAAAIVLREGMSCDGSELRKFAAERLADFKVPRKVLIVEKIPVGPTGKLQRIGLAKALGLA